MILYFILELLEPFKGFCLIPHQIDIAIFTLVISKSNKVLKTASFKTASFNSVHWPTTISMYEAKQLACSLTLSNKGRFCHFTKQT
jgi:hypothetical protein